MALSDCWRHSSACLRNLAASSDMPTKSATRATIFSASGQWSLKDDALKMLIAPGRPSRVAVFLSLAASLVGGVIFQLLGFDPFAVLATIARLLGLIAVG